ncbi:hypothetical protein PRZ48_008363 [Zasmidium cellare]|uniref:Tyrosine specific protein phosphatases domain-containing protein n=1 Tax=Zasmidium cellare TaxID=395010 RepID=A0ABR0EF94_ZASCE|nr:hypothetical protein PRZ48_008363 [Zasmidium cellare]
MATTTTTTKKDQPFQKILNFRDIALSTNPNSPNSTPLKPGLLYRSGIPDNATPIDRLRLSQDYNLKTIIDLRTDSEHVEQARKNAKKISTSPVTEPKDPAEALRIPGVRYEYISLNGHPYSSALIKQLSYWNTAKLFGLYVVGYRTEAIRILGENVMAKRGLVGLAEDSLRHSKAEVKAVFDVLSEESNYPLLVHCTQGKDRTGLVVLLVLLLLGVEKEAIEVDYMASVKGLEAEREERLVQIRAIGLPDEFAGCAEGWVEEVSRCIEEEYGGIEKYLERCGVTREQQERIRKIFR